MHIRSQFESNARNNPASSDCMSGAIRFNASSVTKNATSIALSYPQKRTARRVASNARLLLGKLSAIAPPFEAVSGVRSRNQSRQAPRFSLSAQPRQIFAACQGNGCHPEADGGGQRQAEEGCPHVTLLTIAGGSATGLSATGACIVACYGR